MHHTSPLTPRTGLYLRAAGAVCTCQKKQNKLTTLKTGRQIWIRINLSCCLTPCNFCSSLAIYKIKRKNNLQFMFKTIIDLWNLNNTLKFISFLTIYHILTIKYFIHLYYIGLLIWNTWYFYKHQFINRCPVIQNN